MIWRQQDSPTSTLKTHEDEESRLGGCISLLKMLPFLGSVSCRSKRLGKYRLHLQSNGISIGSLIDVAMFSGSQTCGRSTKVLWKGVSDLRMTLRIIDIRSGLFHPIKKNSRYSKFNLSRNMYSKIMCHVYICKYIYIHILSCIYIYINIHCACPISSTKKKNAITSQPESLNSAPSQIPVCRELTGSRPYPWL